MNASCARRSKRELTASLPASVQVKVLTDRTTGIRASVEHVQMELLLAVVMVVLVIFFFLHSLRATLIASRAGDKGGVPVYRFEIRLQGEGETVFFDV